MNDVSAEDDAQRGLERRALRNASWLAEKLGYRDGLDRRREKTLLLLVAGMAVALVTVVGLSIAISASRDADNLRVQRCLVQFRVDNVERVRRELARERPELPPVQRGSLVESRIGAQAKSKCAAPG